MDCGNFAARTTEFDHWSKTDFIWQMMGKLDYDVVAPGDGELIVGKEKLLALYATQPKVKVVSANVTDKAGKLVWPPYTIVERGGVKFGVTSVTAGGYYKFNVGKGSQVSDDFSFLEIEDVLKKIVPELRKQCDVVVVLDHDGPGDARRVVEGLPGVDVMVVGHNPGYMFNPDRVGETLLIRGGNRGQYLGVTELTLDGSGKIVDYNGEAKPMDEGVAKDATYESLENTFDASYKERENQDKRKTAAEKAMIQGTEKYVGAEMCARCHADIYDKWSHTPHARAYETLVHEGQEANAECVKCHVVGFGEESGYAIDVQKRDEEGNVLAAGDHPALRNVQCESCHGMGTFHGTMAMEKIPSESTCRTCHTGKYGETFDYAAAIAQGVHR